MKNKLEDYIHIENKLSKEVCSELISNITNETWDKHYWHHNEKKQLIEPDKNDLDILFSNPYQRDLLIDPITEVLVNYQKIHSNSIFVHKLSTIRFNKYTENTEMKEHYDLISSIFSNSEGVPIISIVGNLNENYEGGDFYLNKNKISLRCGDIMLFPSTFLYPHKVTKVRKGTRYSFVTWAY
jgi:predicted 2-oxoglutarate/Fe(II)-dependent dioxygenase YbiX